MKPENMFTVLNARDTGIEFSNDLRETLYMNGLFYEYYYNGGGVAVGDFNNDELPDIYFISNLESNKLYLNKGNQRAAPIHFQDITEIAGVKGKAVFPTGVTTVDINSDGFLDIYVSASGRFEDPEKRRNELYVNQGTDENGIPHFEEQAKKYNLDIAAFSTQATFFDYDRDGDLDMFLINHDIATYGDDKLEEHLRTSSDLSGEQLYRNENNFFVDVSANAGIINNRLSYGLGIAVGDLNNDRWPDIYVSHDFSGKDHLYINQRDGTFQESILRATGHISFFSMGNDMADYNNDGWLDIMTVDMVSEDNYGIKTSMSGMNPDQFHKHVDLGLHHQYMFNTLQTNNGKVGHDQTPYFSETAHLAGVSNTDWSWAPLFFDMDNDGYQDVFVSNGIKRGFRNNDFRSYHAKVREELSKNKSIDEEAYINHMMSKMPTRKKNNYFFRNNGNLTFSKMNQAWSLDSLLTSSNGAAYADFDNDGDMDLVVNNMDDAAFIYQNNASEYTDNHHLKLEFKGPPGNSLGIGTKVTITTGMGIQVKEHYLSRGFQSGVAPGLIFGLGKQETIENVTVVWPNGKQEVLTGVAANQKIILSHVNAASVHDPSVENDDVHHLFTDITHELNDFPAHQENEFDDFKRESLLPHKMSQSGPALAVADINNDGLDDFFVGGAMGYSAKLYLQSSDGNFQSSQDEFFSQECEYEDVAATFFDADQDGDLDLYVASGGNERDKGSEHYQDRLYVNHQGLFSASPDALPSLVTSSSCVKPYDYDADGDLDLFVGGRQTPGEYPVPADSYLLENRSTAEKVSFADVTSRAAPMLQKLGMVTDALWTDMDNDGRKDLVVVGEWMPITLLKNNGGMLVDRTKELGLAEETGWWFSIAAADFDGDGDEDLVAGNLGLNYKYQATKEAPFEVYTTDFDDSGDLDIVLGYHTEGNLYPLRGRECSSAEMPYIKAKFPTYDAYGKAKLTEVYDQRKLDSSFHYQANTFATSYLENKRGKGFVRTPLPRQAQVSSINNILIGDFDEDKNLDMVLAGNLYGAEVETPRNDASYGHFLKGDGTGHFHPVSLSASGLKVRGEVRQAQVLKLSGHRDVILFAVNSGNLAFINYEKFPDKYEN